MPIFLWCACVKLRELVDLVEILDLFKEVCHVLSSLPIILQPLYSACVKLRGLVDLVETLDLFKEVCHVLSSLPIILQPLYTCA